MIKYSLKFTPLFAILLSILACGQIPDVIAPSTPVSAPVSTASRDNFVAADPQVNESELDTLVRTARSDIADFWRTQNSGYYAPKTVVGYRGRDANQTVTSCGKADSNNVFYCYPDNGIYYDIDFLDILRISSGDYAPVVVIAHEWAHTIQWQRYGSNNKNRSTIEKEQEADCLAGAYTKYAKEVSHRLELGDYQEAAYTLYDFGDSSFSWLDPDPHGSPEMRVAAFTRGARKGVDSCWGYAEANTTASQEVSSCPGAEPQKVQIGDDAKVCTQSDNLIVRGQPISDGAEIVRIPPGTDFKIIGGPSCANNASWWKVKLSEGTWVRRGSKFASLYQLTSETTGWVREGSDSVDLYFICPVR